MSKFTAILEARRETNAPESTDNAPDSSNNSTAPASKPGNERAGGQINATAKKSKPTKRTATTTASGLANRVALASTPENGSTPPRPTRLRGKRSHPDYEQITAYIRKETHREVKVVLLREGSRQEFSELVEELLAGWLEEQKQQTR